MRSFRFSGLNLKKFIALMAALVLIQSATPALADDPIASAGDCIVREVSNKPQGTVYFANASAKLNSSAKGILDAIIANALRNKDKIVKLEVTGFVSAAGSPSNYLPLSKARARNVERYFKANGLNVQFVSRGVGLSASQSSPAKARKVTIEAVVEELKTTGGTIPKISATSNVPNSFEVGKPVTFKAVELDSSTKLDDANPVKFSISPALPEGLTFDENTGIISGTPKVKVDSTVYTVSASNQCGTVTARVQAAVAPAAPTPPAGGGFVAPIFYDRTITIDSNSYSSTYSLMLDSKYIGDQDEIAEAINYFNNEGLDYYLEGEERYLQSPTLTSTPSLPVPDVNSGPKTYFVSGDTNEVKYSDICDVDALTGKVTFKTIGTCSIQVFIGATGQYRAATSLPVLITLFESCGQVDPQSRPTLTTLEDKIVVGSGGFYGVECAVKSIEGMQSWSYASGPNRQYDEEFNSQPAYIDSSDLIQYISKEDFCDVQKSAAFSLEGIESVKLSDWSYVWAVVSITFENDDSVAVWDSENFLASSFFNGCSTYIFDGGEGATPQIQTINAFYGQKIVPLPVTRVDGFQVIGWALASIVDPTPEDYVDIANLFANNLGDTVIFRAIWADPNILLPA